MSDVSPPLSARGGYTERTHWRRYQQHFPGGLSVTGDNAPTEHWWRWRGTAVHLDRVRRPDAPARVLVVHGVGTYGRMLAPYGRLPAVAGLEYLAVDLPGHGLSAATPVLTYDTWLRCLLDLVAAERAADPRPLLLFGISSGGRLAYDVAALAPDSVTGVVATSLPDARSPEVRQALAGSVELGRLAVTMGLVPCPLRLLPVPLRWLANVAAVSNNTRLAADVCADELGGGGWLPLEFLRTCLAAAPAVEPEEFAGPPVLLAQPAADGWLPPALSVRFLERIAAPNRSVLLSGTGHLPVEEAGLAELDGAVRDFLDELGIGE